MGAELSRWLIAVGAAAAWSGIIVAGMGMSELVPSATLISIGVIATIAGLVGLVIGILIYRATVEQDESTR